jgi:hypothetical protein
MARRIGVPLMCGLLAFERGDFREAVRWIAPIREAAHLFGGSHAQRDLIAQTLLAAAVRAGDGTLAKHLLDERRRSKAHTPLTGIGLGNARDRTIAPCPPSTNRSASTCRRAWTPASCGPRRTGASRSTSATATTETPAELRMPFRVLKNAGVVPHEVELMRRAAALRGQLEAAADAPQAPALRRQLADLQQAIALRLEHLRITGSL